MFMKNAVILIMVVTMYILMAIPFANAAVPTGRSFVVLVQDSYGVIDQFEQGTRGEMSKKGFSMIRSSYNYSWSWGQDMTTLEANGIKADFVVFVQVKDLEQKTTNSSWSSSSVTQYFPIKDSAGNSIYNLPSISGGNQKTRSKMTVYLEVLRKRGKSYEIVFPKKEGDISMFNSERDTTSSNNNISGISTSGSTNQVTSMVREIAAKIANELAANFQEPIDPPPAVAIGGNGNGPMLVSNYEPRKPSPYEKEVTILPDCQGTVNHLFILSEEAEIGSQWVILKSGKVIGFAEAVASRQRDDGRGWNSVMIIKKMRGQIPDEGCILKPY